MIKPVRISIVIPVYNEEENLIPLTESILKSVKKITDKFEIIFVDDGSVDESFRVLEKIKKKHKEVRVMKFRHNFGQSAAFAAGFKAARGKLVVSMDADMQNDPADIPKLVYELSKGYDVVCGWRYPRRDSVGKLFFSFFANLLRKFLTGEKIHDSGCSLRIYKNYAVKDLELYGEMHRYVPALLQWKGYKITEVKVRHYPRRAGKTKYGLLRVYKGLLDLIVLKFWMQYSARPIHFFGAIGLLFGFVGFIIGLFLVWQKLVLGLSIGNRPLLLLGVLMIVLGVQILILGILADMLTRIYYRLGTSPYSIEKEI